MTSLVMGGKSSEMVIQELETASRIFMSPPSAVTQEQRHQAENIFLQFRKTPNPYGMCQSIFMSCSNPQILFETAALLRDAILREWSMLSEEQICGLLQVILELLAQHVQDWKPFVKEKLMELLAVVVKRFSLGEDSRRAHREKFLNHIAQLLDSQNPDLVLLGCGILAALLQEYALSVKSSDIGLSFEDHFAAKKDFEVTHLKSVFVLVLSKLRLFLWTPPFPPSPHLVLRLLRIAQDVLSWSFVARLRFCRRIVSQVETVSFRPPKDWADLIFQDGLVPFLFEVYLHVFALPPNSPCVEDLRQSASLCLLQLASLSDEVLMLQPGERREPGILSQRSQQFLKAFMEGFLKVIERPPVSGAQALNLGAILRRLLIFYAPASIAKTSIDAAILLLQRMSSLTLSLVQAAAQEDMDASSDDHEFMEALDKILEAWLIISHDFAESKIFPRDVFQSCCLQVWDTYLQCRLCPPNGVRAMTEGDLGEEMKEQDETDEVRFAGQLTCIGHIGRKIPAHSTSLLETLFASQISALRLGLASNSSTALIPVFEDLHWLLLISLTTLCTPGDGEAPNIPGDIMDFSIKAHREQEQAKGPVAPAPALEGLEVISSAPSDFQASQDPVIKIFRLTFGLCEVFVKTPPASMSPQLGSSLLKFLSRFAACFLIPKEELYPEISMPFVTVFGPDAPSCQWITEKLSSFVYVVLESWASEEGVVLSALSVLFALVREERRASLLLKSEAIWMLLNSAQKGSFASLPPRAQRNLLMCFVRSLCALEQPQDKKDALSKIVSPYLNSLATLLESPLLVKEKDKASPQLTLLLEPIRGAILGTTHSTCSLIHQLILPLLDRLPHLIVPFADDALLMEAILDLFGTYVETILTQLPQDEAHDAFRVCLNTVRAYAEVNRNTRSRSNEKDDEFGDLAQVIRILHGILYRDFFTTTVDTGADGVGGGKSGFVASEAVMVGVSAILPMLEPEVMSVPALCQSVYKLLTGLTELYPEVLLKADLNLVADVFRVIQLGLSSYGAEAKQLSMEFVSLIGMHLVQNDCSLLIKEVFKPFLRLVLQTSIEDKGVNDILGGASAAMFPLVLLYPEEVAELCRSSMASQEDPRKRERLEQAFRVLQSSFKREESRLVMKRHFREDFEKFLIEARNILIIM